MGSDGAKIEKLGENHFKISLGHAPEHPTWCNMLYFRIVRNAKGCKLRVDVEFTGGDREGTYKPSVLQDGVIKPGGID